MVFKIIRAARRYLELTSPLYYQKILKELRKRRIRKEPPLLVFKEYEEKKEYPGINLPIYTFVFEEELRPEEIKLEYPLIVKNGKVFASARIEFENNSLIYKVIETELSDKLKMLYSTLKDFLRENLGRILTERPEEEIKKLSEDFLSKYSLTEEEKEIILYYIEKDFLGYGKIHALMKDPNIEDISCDGLGIPVFVIHKNPLVGSVPTNIIFYDREELDSLVIRLAQLCGKTINLAMPLVDGILPDGSRLQATLETDIAIRGSNFTIRKFPQKVLSPIEIIKSKTIDPLSLAFVWFCIEHGRNILISGGTGTGKTTLLNVISSFIKFDKKIVSIEDTPEIKLPHIHWIQHVARVPESTGKEGEVDLFELLRAALRQRPDYIIVGEVRGKEASVLFQGMATGHTGLATIHAEDMTKLVDRLKTKPIELSPSLIEILDLVVFVKRIYYKGKFVRRVSNIVEILGATEKDVDYRDVIAWNPLNDSFEIKNKSYTLYKISSLFGLTEREIREEIINRAKLLDFMYRYNITDINSFYSVINSYYINKEELIEAIEAYL
ncbi:MAG: type II/IV secretion system ATPase subunit [Candidatus Aenigmatarchaeota archaeon]